MKVLVVEDSTDVRLLIQLELTARGYTVVTAASAEAGLEAAARELPAVLISDLGLPGIDGIGLVRRLRADERLQRVWAIALSGFGQSAQVQQALAAGFDAALLKPFDTADLVAAVERVTLRPGDRS